MALRWCLEYLASPSCPVRVPVDWSAKATVHSIVRGVISPKRVAALDSRALEQTVIPMVLKSFAHTFVFTSQFPSESIPVRFLMHPSESVATKSSLWANSVFLPMPTATIRSQRVPFIDAKVALFDITLDPNAETINASSDNVSTPLMSPDERLTALRHIGDSLEALGATVVMSQKGIPRYLRTFLEAKGIAAFERLGHSHTRTSRCNWQLISISDITKLSCLSCFVGAVQLLSGASLLSDWRRLDPLNDRQALGDLSQITAQDIGHTQYLRLHRIANAKVKQGSDSRAWPVVTMVLAAPDRFAYDELVYVIETTLKQLNLLVENPSALAGAGCVELHLSAWLRHQALKLQHISQTDPLLAPSDSSKTELRLLKQLRLIVTSFADALDQVVISLGEDDNDALEQLHAANADSLSFQEQESKYPSSIMKLYGWNPLTQSVFSVVEHETTFGYDEDNEDDPATTIVRYARVLDCFQTKKDALTLAVEAVTSLLRLSSVVKA